MNIKLMRHHTVKLKYSNKFLPSTLPKTSACIDELMAIHESTEDEKISSQYPRKIMKGETPISYCSETVVWLFNISIYNTCSLE